MMDDDITLNPSFIDRFERAWQSEQPPNLDDFLPAVDAVGYLGTLQELVIIDIEFRWKRCDVDGPDSNGFPDSIESYIERFPIIGEEPVLSRLIQEEFEIRYKFGDRPAAEAFSERFPLHLDLIDRLSSETAADESSRETKRLSDARQNPVIENYSLISEIGEGGMGSVYLAQQEQPIRRKVAVKVIRSGLDSREVIARFEAERQALAMMDHQNIARVFDAGTTEQGQPYFAMEHVDGIPITDYCRENKSSIPDRLTLFNDVCAAVQHAHQKGILHRDLKPSNVLVAEEDDQPVAKVIDFGLAKAVDSSELLTDKTLQTHVGQVLGTLKYMSPEQASTHESDVDTRTDVYALGVILYELLTGETPLDESAMRDQGILSILELIRDHEPIRPSAKLDSSGEEESNSVSDHRSTTSRALRQLLAGDLDWIVMRALEKERDRRYDSASSFAADVRRFLNDEPVMARPPSATYRLRKFARKNRILVSTGLLVFLMLISGIGATSWQAVRATKAETAAKRQEDLATARAKEAELLRKQEADSRQKAEVAADRAERVLQFVVDSYRAADPTNGAKKDMLARDVLMQALKNIDSRMQEDAESKAALYWALASSFYGLGDYEACQHAARLAAGEYYDLDGPTNDRYLRTQNLIAASRLAIGRPMEAFDYYIATLGVRLEPNGSVSYANALDELVKTSPIAIESLLGVARARITSPNLSPQLAILESRQALHAAEHLSDSKHELVQEARVVLATAHRFVGEYTDSIELYRQVLASWDSDLDTQSLEKVDVELKLGETLGVSGDWKSATETTRTAVSNLEERLGNNHPRTMNARCQLADSLMHTGQRADAANEFTTVRNEATRNQQAFYRATRGLAVVALQENRIGSALELYEQDLEGVAWVRIVAGQPIEAANTYLKLSEQYKDLFNQVEVRKWALSLLQWANDPARSKVELQRLDAIRGSSKPFLMLSSSFAGDVLDVPLELLRARQAIMDANTDEARSIVERLLDQKVIGAVDPGGGETDPSSAKKMVYSHSLSETQRASAELLRVELDRIQEAVADDLKSRAIKAFEILHKKMQEIPSEKRWIVGAACELIAEICVAEGSIDEADQWRNRKSEVESKRVQLTLLDPWKSGLPEPGTGLSAVPASPQ